jgi:RNA polymerase primary sigma factor
MPRYNNPAIRQLKDQQVRYAPHRVREEQIDRAEQLLEKLDPQATYRYQDLCLQVTGCPVELYPDLELTGVDAAHDLRLFIDDLSASLNLAAENSREQILTVDDLSRKFKVSTKTVDRWRSRGLVSRRFKIGNRKRIGFLQSSVERFVAEHKDEVDRGANFSQLTESEKHDIIDRARRLARTGASPAEISRRIARHMGRAIETIRYTLKNHDLKHPDSAVFPNAVPNLSEELKRDIFSAYRNGVSVDRLARRYYRTRTSIYRVIGEMRAKQLIDQPIEFMYDKSFDEPGIEAVILCPEPAVPEQRGLLRSPPGLPPYLAQLYTIPLLSKEQEFYYFRKMNYLRFKAARLRDRLDVAKARPQALDEIEKCLEESLEIKNLLIRSNLRLVVSIAKKHMRPTDNFFEMVSDGNISLIRAIEKFDFSRGFKFSTYASWSIMKNFARSIPAQNIQRDRYRTGSEELFLSSIDPRTDQFEQEMANQRQHEAIEKILNRLDERERNIIMLRFGLTKDGESQTLEQLGGRFGVTKERIRQLEHRALLKLRKIAKSEKMDIPGVL